MVEAASEKCLGPTRERGRRLRDSLGYMVRAARVRKNRDRWPN